MGLLLITCQNKTTTQTADGSIEIDAEEFLKRIGDAYLFGYPLVMMEMTKNSSTNIETPHPSKSSAPINQLGHYRTFPDHTMTKVVKPNVDTYYSIAWLDLSEGPQVLSMPATDRYYLLPFYDAYSNVFASPGTRTTGRDAQEFVIVGPNWEGNLPEGLSLIQAPTEMVWMLGRIQVNSPEDGATTVRAIQDQMKLVPLSAYGDPTYKAPKGMVKKDYENLIPSKAIQTLDVGDFLNQVAQLMVKNPPRVADSAMVKKLATIGLVAGEPFELTMDNLVLQMKLKGLPRFIHNKMKDRRDNPKLEDMRNGWNIITEGLGEYGTDYLRRAYVGFVGFGANWPADAIYPTAVFDRNGDRLEASKNYQLHFEADQLPPVNAFWSLTAYNADEFLVKNDLNRFALGDRDPIIYNEDGSLDFYIQSQPPTKEKMANWLPIPKEGRFTLVMRLYWPKEEALNGAWKPPFIVRK